MAKIQGGERFLVDRVSKTLTFASMSLKSSGKFAPWKAALALLVAWLGAFVAMIELKLTVLRLVLPLVALLIVIYLATCTILFLKNRR